MKSSTITPRKRAPTNQQHATPGRPPGRQSSGKQDAQALPAKQQRKRKATTPAAPRPGSVVDLIGDTPPSTAKKAKVQGQQQQEASPIYERRARRWRDHPPNSYLDRLERISVQRMFVVDHEVAGSEEGLEISFGIVGSTGNLYKTVIRKEPACDCPDGAKGNQCKHICYVLLHALKAPSHLQYQLAFLSSELREMYHGSPLSRVETALSETNDGNRKPVEGDCPICFMEFEPNEELVWCKAACGNNIHKACFGQWAATCRASGGVRCVYCRTAWKYDEPEHGIGSLRQTGNLNEEGYINVAEQYGLSPERDCWMYSRFSTAHPLYSFWRGRGRGRGHSGSRAGYRREY